MKGLVVFDVDGTVTDGIGQARPGIYELFEVLHALGYQIRLWSAGGRAHARQVQQELRLPYVDGLHDKPRKWAETAEYCHQVMGAVPDLVVDDTEVGPLLGVGTLKVRHAFEMLHPEVVFR